MNVVSFCKKVDYSEFLDNHVFQVLEQDIQDLNNPEYPLQVIIADDHDIIESLRKKFKQDLLLLIPLIGLLGKNLSYSAIHNCIASGATILVVRIL
ncbi:MAG: hypothetical protein OEV66_00980 [Spirochaetia bacterium]|nr:hypothetical protein [Spirochaetia bacterium]